jgi:hypothetical protein
LTCRTNLEYVEGSAGVESRLLVGSVEDSSLGALVGGEGGGKVKLEALGNEVVNFNLIAQDVGGGPGLGQGESVDFVGPLSLNVTSDEVGFVVAGTSDLEGDIGRGLGLDLKRGAVVVVVLGEEVGGGLAEILERA